MTPASVHSGKCQEIQTQRELVLRQAFTVHPERFVNGVPKPPRLHTEAWINPPSVDDPGSRRKSNVPDEHPRTVGNSDGPGGSRIDDLDATRPETPPGEAPLTQTWWDELRPSTTVQTELAQEEVTVLELH